MHSNCAEGRGALNGGDGNDLFFLYGSAGTIDGGAGSDTVVAPFLFDYSFSNVEILDASGFGPFMATAKQLSAFATLTDSVRPADSPF